jgi:hypothetical protein
MTIIKIILEVWQEVLDTPWPNSGDHKFEDGQEVEQLWHEEW